ncbi:hypothetical protein FAI41_03390 [Acetobacteraceae bacterium]|nr:hypothetical protein FAI41_03390 [Acetobacteraceae bacterium]
MSASIHLERRWLMDAFGGFLQYDSTSQQLITTPFTPQGFPNLFTFVPVPEKFPHRAVLRLTHSIPSYIPACRFLQIAPHSVAIQNVETNRYLSSLSGTQQTSWHPEEIHDWEHFFLLNKQMLTGLSLLADPDLAEISNNNESLSQLVFTGNPNQAKIGSLYISLSHNLEEIAKLADYKAHEENELLLHPLHSEEETFSLKIKLKRNFHLNTLTL